MSTSIPKMEGDGARMIRERNEQEPGHGKRLVARQFTCSDCGALRYWSSWEDEEAFAPISCCGD